MARGQTVPAARVKARIFRTALALVGLLSAFAVDVARAAVDDPIDALNAAIERGGMNVADTAALYNSRGDAFVGRSMLEAALADFTQAIALRPDYADAYANRAGVYFAERRFDPALADYTAALQIEPTEPSHYVGRAQVYYYLKRYDASVADLKSAELYSPASRHAILWLYLAEWRSGGKPAATPAANSVRWSATDWPGALIALYRGEGTVDAMLAAARASDPVIRLTQECEALFYGGQYRLMRGAAAEGHDLLRRSLDACPPSRRLHSAAKIELDRTTRTR